MTTAYTNSVETGETTSLRSFALKCARAMDFMDGHHESLTDGELVVTEDSYYQSNLTECRQALFDATSRSMEEWQKLYEQAKSRLEGKPKDIKTTEQELERLRSMLTKCRAFQPPTERHDGLQRFMMSQLQRSIRSKKFFIKFASDAKPELPPFDEWMKKELVKLGEDVARAVEELKAHQRRVLDTNTWIRQLVDALPEEE